MVRTLKIILLLGIFLLVSCTNSTSPISNKIKLDDYSNQYKMMYIFENNIFSINSDGTNLTQITDYNGHMQNLVVNSDFSKIAFSSGEIYIMNSDGSNLKKISNFISEENKLSPKFLPTEEALIYDCNGKLYKVNYNGSETSQITSDSVSIPSDEYSVSNNKIIFRADIIRGAPIGPGLYIIDSDGLQINRFVDGSDYYNPSISPDGTKICYWSSDNNNSEIFVMNIDGSNKINLSNSPSKDKHPGWLPNGNKIYFESNRDGKNHIYIINPDGTNLTKITKKSADYYFFPTWSPDLSRMSFAAMTGDAYIRDTIYIIDIETGERIKLTSGITSPIWTNILN